MVGAVVDLIGSTVHVEAASHAPGGLPPLATVALCSDPREAHCRGPPLSGALSVVQNKRVLGAAVGAGVLLDVVMHKRVSKALRNQGFLGPRPRLRFEAAEGAEEAEASEAAEGGQVAEADAAEVTEAPEEALAAAAAAGKPRSRGGAEGANADHGRRSPFVAQWLSAAVAGAVVIAGVQAARSRANATRGRTAVAASRLPSTMSSLGTMPSSQLTPRSCSTTATAQEPGAAVAESASSLSSRRWSRTTSEWLGMREGAFFNMPGLAPSRQASKDWSNASRQASKDPVHPGAAAALDPRRSAVWYRIASEVDIQSLDVPQEKHQQGTTRQASRQSSVNWNMEGNVEIKPNSTVWHRMSTDHVNEEEGESDAVISETDALMEASDDGPHDFMQVDGAEGLHPSESSGSLRRWGDRLAQQARNTAQTQTAYHDLKQKLEARLEQLERHFADHDRTHGDSQEKATGSEHSMGYYELKARLEERLKKMEQGDLADDSANHDHHDDITSQMSFHTEGHYELKRKLERQRRRVETAELLAKENQARGFDDPGL